MISEKKVIKDMAQEGIEITCNHCKKSQTYTMRSQKIPNRPKTQCQNCEKWIYIDRSLLVKDDQTKNDQRPNDQKHINQTTKSIEKPNKPKIKQSSSLTKNDQMTNDEKLYIYLRAISGDLVIAMNYAINAIKNKPEVKEKRAGATRYDYFKSWSEYRAFFKKLDDELKRELKIIK